MLGKCSYLLFDKRYFIFCVVGCVLGCFCEKLWFFFAHRLVFLEIKILTFLTVNSINLVLFLFYNSGTAAFGTERIFVALVFSLLVKDGIDNSFLVVAVVIICPYLLGDFFKLGDSFG